MPGDPYIQTSKPSTKIFALANDYAIPGSNVAKLHHDVREPARTVDMVPSLTNNSLLSGGKFAQAGYVAVCDDKEVNLYDMRTVKIGISEEAVLKGWRYPRANLWRIPLVKCKITNENTETLLLNKHSQPQSNRYVLPTTVKMRERINMVIASPTDTISNVYELTSMERAVRYLHGAAGFPTKATWIKAIRNGAYVSWPLINVKNVNKYFPESEETQKGNMQRRLRFMAPDQRQ